MLTFFVPGVPKGTQTGSVVWAGGRAIPKRRGEGWSAAFGLMARHHRPPRPFEGPLSVVFTFFMPRPKKCRRPYPSVRPDCSNLVKGLEDAGNGVLWMDDSQIVELIVRKRYAEGHVGVHVLVNEP